MHDGSEPRALRIDLFTDIVCPWCRIGAARLDEVLAARAELAVEVVLHPFLLNEHTPAEGEDLGAMLREKLGADPARVFATVVAAGREAGVTIDFTRQTRVYPTLKAHALVGWAQERGRGRDVHRAVMRAYFEDGASIVDDEVLAAIASAHGLDGDAARAAVHDTARVDAVRAAARAASREGIRGVPFFIVDEELAFSGAQPRAVFDRVLDEVLAGR